MTVEGREKRDRKPRERRWREGMPRLESGQGTGRGARAKGRLGGEGETVQGKRGGWGEEGVVKGESDISMARCNCRSVGIYRKVEGEDESGGARSRLSLSLPLPLLLTC